MLTYTILATSYISSTVMLMLNEIGVHEYDIITVTVLIILLYAKEVLSASKYWTKPLATSFNMGIFTILIILASIVIFKISEIL